MRSPDAHRIICLGNWSTLLPKDAAVAVTAVLTGISRDLVHRIKCLWEMRKQAKYLVGAALSSTDPALLGYFQQKFKPYRPRWLGVHVLYRSIQTLLLTTGAQQLWIVRRSSPYQHNTGELSAFYHPFSTRTSANHDRLNFSILTDSEYCVYYFVDNRVQGRCNKKISRRIRRGLVLIQRQDSISIERTKAHCSSATLDALGNAAAEDWPPEDAPAPHRASTSPLPRSPDADEHPLLPLYTLVG